jgi:hypothetical protein
MEYQLRHPERSQATGDYPQITSLQAPLPENSRNDVCVTHPVAQPLKRFHFPVHHSV